MLLHFARGNRGPKRPRTVPGSLGERPAPALKLLVVSLTGSML